MNYSDIISLLPKDLLEDEDGPNYKNHSLDSSAHSTEQSILDSSVHSTSIVDTHSTSILDTHSTSILNSTSILDSYKQPIFENKYEPYRIHDNNSFTNNHKNIYKNHMMENNINSYERGKTTAYTLNANRSLQLHQRLFPHETNSLEIADNSIKRQDKLSTLRSSLDKNFKHLKNNTYFENTNIMPPHLNSRNTFEKEPTHINIHTNENTKTNIDEEKTHLEQLLCGHSLIELDISKNNKHYKPPLTNLTKILFQTNTVCSIEYKISNILRQVTHDQLCRSPVFSFLNNGRANDIYIGVKSMCKILSSKSSISSPDGIYLALDLSEVFLYKVISLLSFSTMTFIHSKISKISVFRMIYEFLLLLTKYILNIFNNDNLFYISGQVFETTIVGFVTLIYLAGDKWECEIQNKMIKISHQIQSIFHSQSRQNRSPHLKYPIVIINCIIHRIVLFANSAMMPNSLNLVNFAVSILDALLYLSNRGGRIYLNIYDTVLQEENENDNISSEQGNKYNNVYTEQGGKYNNFSTDNTDSILIPDKFTFSSIIKGYCSIGYLGSALSTFDSMLSFGRNICADLVIYNTLLDGCVRRKVFDICDELLRDMLRPGKITPNAYTLSILIKRYGREGKIKEAFSICQTMPFRFGFRANAHVWTCLISSCIVHGHVNLAELVFSKMEHSKLLENNNGFRYPSELLDEIYDSELSEKDVIMPSYIPAVPDCKTYETMAIGLLKNGYRSRGEYVFTRAVCLFGLHSLSNKAIDLFK